MIQQLEDDNFEVTTHNRGLIAENVMDAVHDVEELTTSEKGAVYTFEVTSEGRFNQWLRALKARYWIDFGNKDEYKVDWLRKTDEAGVLCELCMQLFQVCNGKPNLLFCITVYINKRKFMVQGKHKNSWKENEFTNFRSFVDGLCMNDALTNTQINKLYADIFNCENPLLSEDACLDALVDSDGDDDNLVEDLNVPSTISTIPVKQKKKLTTSPRRKISSRNKISPLKKPEMATIKESSQKKLVLKLMNRIEELTASSENTSNSILKQSIDTETEISTNLSHPLTPNRQKTLNNLKEILADVESRFVNFKIEMEDTINTMQHDLEHIKDKLVKSGNEHKSTILLQNNQIEDIKQENDHLKDEIIKLQSWNKKLQKNYSDFVS